MLRRMPPPPPRGRTRAALRRLTDRELFREGLARRFLLRFHHSIGDGAAMGRVLRQMQSGYVYHYAFTMIIGLFALLTWWVVRP